MTRFVIYTDLDGTLLDHDNYSHAAADELLRELEEMNIPVVPCTSKTRAELMQIRAELNNRHPFVVENGAAVFVPDGYFEQPPRDAISSRGFWVKEFVLPSDHWRRLLVKTKPKSAASYRCFSNLDTEQIAALTGLTTEQAELAAQREYGEPVHWIGSDSERETFIHALQQLGARVLQGGRFLHVSGNCDKGRALQWLNTQFAASTGKSEPVSIALGDSQNDCAMLEAADHAIVVRSPAHPPPKLSHRDHIVITRDTGPRGWNEGIRRVLEKQIKTRG